MMLDTTERLLISAILGCVSVYWILAISGLLRNPLIFVSTP